MDAGARFIGEINYVLDRSDFEEQIVRMILKVENTFKHKDQSNAINDTTSNTVRGIKAIKAMQSTIRPERYDPSDMVSNTIRTNPGVVTLSVALTQRPKTQAKSLMLRG